MTATTDHLIAFTGRAGSGKTAAADYLAQRYGFVQVAFADPLKESIEQMMDAIGVDYAYLFDRDKKERTIPGLPLSAREWMQRLGDFYRGIDPDWFVRAAAYRLGLPAAPVHDRICLTDVRFPNELYWTKAMGGHIVKLHRSSADPVRPHDSEAHVDTLDAHTLLLNDGATLPSLHDMLDGLMASRGLDPRDELEREWPQGQRP